MSSCSAEADSASLAAEGSEVLVSILKQTSRLTCFTSPVLFPPSVGTRRVESFPCDASFNASNISIRRCYVRGRQGSDGARWLKYGRLSCSGCRHLAPVEMKGFCAAAAGGTQGEERGGWCFRNPPKILMISLIFQVWLNWTLITAPSSLLQHRPVFLQLEHLSCYPLCVLEKAFTVRPFCLTESWGVRFLNLWFDVLCRWNLIFIQLIIKYIFFNIYIFVC